MNPTSAICGPLKHVGTLRRGGKTCTWVTGTREVEATRGEQKNSSPEDGEGFDKQQQQQQQPLQQQQQQPLQHH
ncbi:hypothetical protein VYU27_001140 [Nannochloropsis oceanica]